MQSNIRDLILKTEAEIMEISLGDPLIAKGRKFLKKTPSHKVDSLLERSNDKTLSGLVTFFHFLLKREDIFAEEKEKIRTFVKAGKIEKGKRERKRLYEKIEMQKLVIKELDQTLRITRKLLHEEISSHREPIRENQQSIKSCKLIILLLSALNCVESTTQVTISTMKGNTVKVRTISKAMLSAVIAFWTGCSICRRKNRSKL